MNTPKTILTPLLAALALASIGAQGATVSYGPVTIGPTPVEINGNLNLQKFDSNLGTLTQIKVTLSGATASNVRNNEAVGSPNWVNFFVNITTTLKFQGPSGPTELIIVNPSGNIASLAPGATSALWVLAGGPTDYFPAIVAGWQAAGGGPLVVPVSTTTGAATGGGIGGSASFQTADLLTASVTYTYETTRVPEPKVYGALGAVLCLGLLGYRQYRLKHS